MTPARDGGGMAMSGGGMQQPQMGQQQMGGQHADPRLNRIAELIDILKPLCKVESLGEMLLGGDSAKRYGVRKGEAHVRVQRTSCDCQHTHGCLEHDNRQE